MRHLSAHSWLIRVLPVMVLLLVACSGRRSGPPAGGDAAGVKETAAAAQATVQAASSGGNAVAATAQALAATAQAGVNQAATAAGDVAGTAQAAQATVAALATQAQPTTAALTTQAAALAATAQAALTAVVPQADAAAVITQYAQDVLGISVSVVKASGLTGDIDRQINLSEQGEAAQSGSLTLAVQTYGALLVGGAGSVSYGSGAVSGDLTVDISAASLGAFSFDHEGLAQSEADALALALQTFPGLSNRTFTAYPAAKGYAWLAEGQVPGFDVQTKQATLVAEKVLIGVTPTGPRKSAVYAVVGKGDFSANVAP